jgi:hypothetical protein
MSKRCPPGVICIENITIFVIIIAIMVIIYYVSKPHQPKVKRELVLANAPVNMNSGFGWDLGNIFTRPMSSNSYSNVANDVLLNPYEAPLRDDRYFPSDSSDPRGVPINVSTRAVDTTYRQVGILKRVNGKETILPLMGRPLFTSRDKWNFYTMTENNVKLPVTFKQRSCTNEYGCDNIYNGDTVYVDGMDSVFKATIYENATMKYLPFL